MKPRIAFLTGQSDPGRCALSPAQRATLDTLAPHAAGVELHPCNFPWDTNTAPWRAVPLLRASLANSRQYLAARRNVAGTLEHDVHNAARARLLAAPRTLLLVGSCGLALLDALVAPFDAGQRTRLRAVSYGGVAPRWPAGIDGLQLRGRRDHIAAWLGPVDGPSPQTVDHGHMDYLDGDAVAQAARAHLAWLREGA
jgi:hypothetical protein